MSKKTPATQFVAFNIRKRREELGFTQHKMAAKLQLSQNAYSKIELGYTRITLDKLFMLAEVLEMTPESLFTPAFPAALV